MAKKTTAIVKWDAELAKRAQEAADLEQMPGGSFISVRGGKFKVAGSPAGDKLQVIVLASVYENAKYDGDFDPDAPQPPTCYAFAKKEEDLKPHEKVKNPCSGTCADCEFNVFGTSSKGKGKACKNVKRLAVISANGLKPNGVKDSEIMFVKVPVTSVKGWAYYVKSLANVMKRPTFAVVTELTLVPDERSQFKLVFNSVAALDDGFAGVIMDKVEEAGSAIVFPYPDAQPKPQAAQKGKAKGGAPRGKAQKTRKF